MRVAPPQFDNANGHDLRAITTTGDYRVAVVLVEFADASFSQGKGDPQALIDEMLNGDEFTYQNATGSANAYYRAISRGQFNPVFDVYGPVRLPRNEKDYVVTDPDDTFIDPATGETRTVYQAGRMVEDAVKALDEPVDFSLYDPDKDGKVDFIYLFFAGKGATTGGNRETTIWPHASTLTATIGAPVEADGVLIDRYATSSELGSDNRLSGIGTFCHEFAHVLGLPDLYDTSSNSGQASKCFTPGPFSCMDSGNYNNSEHTPPVFSAYEQYAMEWMRPSLLAAPGSYTLPPLEAWPMAFKVGLSDKPTEYYILENRGAGYYDSRLPGAGLLAWHIDFDARLWQQNAPNNDASHMRIDLIEADSEKSESTRAGDPFPGSAGINEFTARINPTFSAWDGRGMGVELRRIVRNFDSTVSFEATSSDASAADHESVFVGEAPEVRFSSPDASTLRLSWPAAGLADNVADDAAGEVSYMVSVFPADRFSGEILGYDDYVDGWFFRNVGNPVGADGECSVDVTGLEPNTSYCAMIYPATEGEILRPLYPTTGRTVDPDDFRAAVPNLRLRHTAAGEVELEWDAMPSAEEATLHVVTLAPGDVAATLDVDFSGSQLPEGWVATGEFDSRENYCGASAPSWRMPSSFSRIESALMEQEIGEMQFWVRQRYADKSAFGHLDILTADASGEWRYHSSMSDFSDIGEMRHVDFGEGVHGVRLLFVAESSALDLNIDDILLTLRQPTIETPAAEAVVAYSDSEPVAMVSGLREAMQYAAYVEFCDASGATTRSRQLRFNPTAPSGVESIETGDAGFAFRLAEGVILPADDSLRYDLFSIDGQAVAIAHCGALRLPAKGIYLLRDAASGHTVKLAF